MPPLVFRLPAARPPPCHMAVDGLCQGKATDYDRVVSPPSRKVLTGADTDMLIELRGRPRSRARGLYGLVKTPARWPASSTHAHDRQALRN